MSSRADDRLGAVVLCGGQSRRMDRPKAWLPFGDETLLQRIVRLLSAVTDPIVVVAGPEQDLPALPASVAVARDPIPGRGPLQGVAVGLKAMAPHAELAYVSPTDAPFLAPAFVLRMRALAEDNDIVVVEDGGHRHALAAVYATRLHREADELLAVDERRMGALLDRARTRTVTRAEVLADPGLAAADPHLASLDNINTPEDYRAAIGKWRDAHHESTKLPSKSKA
jgi:molybdopterin-guanine dinucleotide biosynthesis protein A